MAKILITSTNFIDLPALSLNNLADLIFYEELLKITTLNTLSIQNFLVEILVLITRIFSNG
jgi:hypothetical protein